MSQICSHYNKTMTSFFVGAMLNAPGVAEKEQDQFLVPQVILEWRIGPLALG